VCRPAAKAVIYEKDKSMTMASLPTAPFETWTLAKPVARGRKGVVVSQEIEAAMVGAAMIEAGGNAIDGAVAAALALTVTEPWMSGLGGGGFMVVYVAAQKRVRVVDFGMIAPSGLNPADYPLTGATGADLFGWPAVMGDVNFHGVKSIAVPGSVAGYALAAKSFGRKSWGELIAPAVSLAERGHRVGWWTTMNVASEAGLLGRYSGSKAVWLPGGLVPTMATDIDPNYLPIGNLSRTLRNLAKNGPRAFYEGPIAKSIAADTQAAGGTLSEDDLASYAARIVDPLSVTRGDAVYNLPGGLTAGPTFADALSHMPTFSGAGPDPETYAAYARCLIGSYERRLETMGHAGDIDDRSCTTHISAADAEGNMVMMTTTLLSRFGSRVVLPKSGVLMNNGINWFDPRPNRANSIAPGQRPLSNMCPIIATKGGKPWFGFGASGGRKIMPAVFQLASFANDFGMDLESALAQPRIDISQVDRIVHDGRLDEATAAALKAVAPSRPWSPTAVPSLYAVPSGAVIEDDCSCLGGAHIHSPVAGVATV
jgi:gamma-glutamyltranspeptidase/glutathione hydrolase